MNRLLIMVCSIVALVCSPATAAAQGGRDAHLVLTVVDQTGAIIPAAVVTAVRADDPAKTVVGPVKTNDKGIATIASLPPGIYTIEAEFPGFEKRTMKDIQLGFNIGAQNLTNRVNRIGYNGTMTSPFFHQPSGVGARASWTSEFPSACDEVSFQLSNLQLPSRAD